MNSLGVDINGAVVVVKPDRRHILPNAVQDADPDTDPRLFAVPPVNPGEGAFARSSGHLLFGYWVETGKRAVIDSRDIERMARLPDFADIEIALKCLTCEGTGAIGHFTCVICHGSGAFTPLIPVEA